mmetsp:Transcript_46460/g.55884  ORF Transcript_46460/g.55884 Transcript_46460/m.55884 type:complete len:100 (+) Transcript_46460:85-384(+)
MTYISGFLLERFALYASIQTSLEKRGENRLRVEIANNEERGPLCKRVSVLLSLNKHSAAPQKQKRNIQKIGQAQVNQMGSAKPNQYTKSKIQAWSKSVA